MTCSSFYLNVMKFSDWCLLELCFFCFPVLRWKQKTGSVSRFLFFLLLYLFINLNIHAFSRLLYIILTSPHECASLRCYTQKHKTSRIWILPETTLHTHSTLAAFLIVSCSSSSPLPFLFPLYVPLSQRALCHSQDPLLQVFRAIVSTTERRRRCESSSVYRWNPPLTFLPFHFLLHRHNSINQKHKPASTWRWLRLKTQITNHM